MKSKSAYEKVYVSFQGRNNKKSITEATEDVILAFLDMSATGRWNPLGATERLGATTVASWSGQTRGGWTMVPAQGPLVDGRWYEGWLVDCASTGTPRFVEEDDVSRRANRNGRILIEHADNIDIIIEARDFHADTLDIALLKNVPFQTRLHASQALDSDHLPVLMHIGDEASDANRNATVQITNWSRFAEILETDFGPVPRIESVADLESAAGAFEEKIKTAMSDSTRTRVEPPEKENLPQWIVDLIRAKNLARRQAYRTGSAVDRTEANRLGNEVKFALIDHRSPLPPIHGTRGLVFSDDEKAETFADSLELQCRPNIADADLDHIEEVEHDIQEILSEPNDTPITPTSPEEVREIIGSLKPATLPLSVPMEKSKRDFHPQARERSEISPKLPPHQSSLERR
ncbi:hypothetical protein GEV33_006114 [Tenebrio molitor]|uniref:Uncharacterized protein n=1 Tax=Tenebrio molitor TaxID=7067 RepID=A0A8J6HLN3_TENMO|nr:hypothetical protein GEV33_006114 [Tenebrio molitor]